MKISKRNRNKKFIIIFILIILINYSTNNKIKSHLKQDLIPNDEYKQAPLPANIVVIQDIPQYGEKSLEKWEDYVQGNLKMLKDFKKREDRAMLHIYNKRMSRMANMYQEITISELENNMKKIINDY